MALPISPHTRNRVLAVAILGFAVVCVAVPRPWHGSVRAAALGAVRPPHRALAAAYNGLRRAIDRLRVLPGYADEIQRLRDQNRALREALARQTDETRRARAQLRNVQGFEAFRTTTPVRTLSVVPAGVIAADPSAWRHHLVVDRGSAHGVRRGAAAVCGSSVVGTVVDVRPRAARVRLLIDPKARIEVRVARTQDIGVLGGTGARDGLLHIKWLSLKPPVDGDLVVTAGRIGIIPPGLLAGQIAGEPRRTEPPCYDATVRPPLRLDQLTELLIVSYTPDAIDDLLREEAPEE